MIIEKIYPQDGQKYSLAWEDDGEIGAIGPSGFPWRFFTTEEELSMSSDQQNAISKFKNIQL